MEHELQRKIPLREWKPKNPHWAQEGFEVDVADLPPDVTTVRFYCSW